MAVRRSPRSSAPSKGSRGPLGNVYLSDTDNHRIRKVTPGGTISTLAGTGVAGSSGDGGSAARAQLNVPYGLAADGNGNVYVADVASNRVRRSSPDGTIATFAEPAQRGLRATVGRP